MRLLVITAILIPMAARSAAQDRPARPPAVSLEWKWLDVDCLFDRAPEMVAFSPDGTRLAAGSRETIYVWAADTGAAVTRMKLPQEFDSHTVAFSADGKSLVSVSRNDKLIRVWDAKTGKAVSEWPRPESTLKETTVKAREYEQFAVNFLGLSPNGAFASFDVRTADGYDQRIIDTATGKLVSTVRQPSFGYDLMTRMAFAPDGKTFALDGPIMSVRIFDTAAAKLVKDCRPAAKARPLRVEVRYSSDGQYLQTWEHISHIYSERQYRDVYRSTIWNAADGKRFFEANRNGGWISADNRILIDDSRTVYDLLSDAEVPIGGSVDASRKLKGISPDGKTLAFAGWSKAAGVRGPRGFTIYLAPPPVLPLPPGISAVLSPADIEFLWASAVSGNRFRQDYARKRFADHPDLVLELAAKKLKPVSATERSRIAGLIGQLDDDSADVRDKATEELERDALRFETELRAAFVAARTTEAKNRLTLILDKSAEAGPPPALAAELGGVDFLESLSDPKARTILKALAAGAPEARLTESAAEALKRRDLKSPPR